MRELSFDEGKKLMLDTLINVAEFCKKHKINYSLSYGTLIGAIRHKGFIPWDDDIDIIMKRDDYEKFIALYSDQRYELISGERQANHLHVRVSDSKTKVVFSKNTLNSKIYNSGVWIDVFPIDMVPDTQRGFIKHVKTIKFFTGLQIIAEIGGKDVFRRLLHYPLKPFSKLWGEIAQNLMLKFNDKNSHMVANLAVRYRYKSFPPFPLEYMYEFVDVEFEGHIFKAIKQYDVFLRGIYGDYMKLPPEEKRIAHHYYNAYIKD